MTAFYRADTDVEDAALAAAQIHTACFPHSWDEANFRNLLTNPASILFFASDDAEVALALFHKVEDEAEILTLGTKPESQRDGIARKLLTYAEKALHKEGVKRVFLEVGETNIPAISLYDKIGYREFSRRAGYYPDSSSAICMEKVL